MKFNWKKLKNIRLSHNKPTQQCVAEAMGWEKSTSYNKLERGHQPAVQSLRIEQLQNLADFYEIDLSNFFEFNGHENISGIIPLQKGTKIIDYYRDIAQHYKDLAESRQAEIDRLKKKLEGHNENP